MVLRCRRNAHQNMSIQKHENRFFLFCYTHAHTHKGETDYHLFGLKKRRTDTALRCKPICFHRMPTRSRWNTSQSCMQQKQTWEKSESLLFRRANAYVCVCVVRIMLKKIVLVSILLRLPSSSRSQKRVSIIVCTACAWLKFKRSYEKWSLYTRKAHIYRMQIRFRLKNAKKLGTFVEKLSEL